MQERFLLNIPDYVVGWRLVARGSACVEPLGKTGRGHQRWWVQAAVDQPVATYQRGSERMAFSVVLESGRAHLLVQRQEEIIPDEWETLQSHALSIQRAEQNYIETVLAEM